MGARISLVNRIEAGTVLGLDARVDFDLCAVADAGSARYGSA
ncbi:MAG: hypothetical protein RL375_195 [Pseudomonadota bacterium]|jgi:hypothetical protein